ncbi:hypothetical protein PHLCEN_2v9570 [Hermanssonia centrifuga]|uniref:Uncharacterized protein n=1 Tax=Hermanssonia centrifuga TaxID=98765 RepID=A0A2R6NQD5_9APHY|nr:hypothetical protein PHLCEN_2v9570 [Hermanssonia centrifuga]
MKIDEDEVAEESEMRRFRAVQVNQGISKLITKTKGRCEADIICFDMQIIQGISMSNLTACKKSVQ